MPSRVLKANGKYISIAFIIFLLTGTYTEILSQTDSVMYTKDFRFQDGFYLTFDEFRNNNPSITEYIVSDKYNSHDDIYGADSKKKIKFINENGDEEKLRKREIWGACIHGRIYIYHNEVYYELSKIGAIGLFYKQYQQPDFDTVLGHSQSRSSMEPKYDMYMYLLDCQSGNIYGYWPGNMEFLLKPDPELYKEYKSIKGYKKKTIKIFSFMNRFNERNPIYFPVNKKELFDPNQASKVEFE